MAKVERLMQLSNLIKKREAISVKEMSRACGVSQRTIYRYLNTLSKLGTQDFGTEGGMVELRKDDSWSGLNNSDLDMIDFCLRHNPLTKFPFFMERLSRVRRKVSERRRRTPEEASHFLLAEEAYEEARDSGESDILERFVRAKTDARKVAVTLRGSDRGPRTLIPRAVKIGRGGITLVVSEHSDKDVSEISLADIEELVVSADGIKDKSTA